ncbi:MAG: ABC transporter substrate-binding protein [Leptothrix sp. (in: b-proteobacteria)]
MRRCAFASLLAAVHALAPAAPAAAATLSSAPAADAALAPFIFLTNWSAQAEHGGYYAALAAGLYREHGLDVTIRMGGPQLNALQILAAGQADCILGASDLQMLQARAHGLPVVMVAAMFQKDPEVLIAHDDVHSLADIKGKTVLISAMAHQGFWPWLKAQHGFSDAQTRPYTFNLQPFLLDANLVQQGYVTAEPFALQAAGARFRTFLLSDYGYPGYASTVACLASTVEARRSAVAGFVSATAEGWKRYLADPAPAHALIKQANPAIGDAQLAYSWTQLKQTALVTGGDAAHLGIGALTEARARKTHDFMLAAHLLDTDAPDWQQAYDPRFVREHPVLP